MTNQVPTPVTRSITSTGWLPCNAPAPARLGTTYEVKVGARLDERWRRWFDGFALAPGDGGTTLITGPVADQAALYGLLMKVRDLGIALISVEIVSD